MAKKRTVNELRQVKDSVYTHPKSHLTAQEQRLLDDLNYKAKVILDIEAIFEKNNIPVNSKKLYDLDIKRLESILLAWK
tara:strand:- start:682 stop:918 length:237 start_codon:yes stop_codon:yes gene_type:complete